MLSHCGIAWSSDCPLIDKDQVRKQLSVSTSVCPLWSPGSNGESVTQQRASIVLQELAQVFKLLLSD